MTMQDIEQRRLQKRLSRQKRLAKGNSGSAHWIDPTPARRVPVPKKPTGKTFKQYGYMLCQLNGAPVLWTDTYSRAE